MSFPKARILRFNEISTCAPPPGKYDPKYDVKVKGAIIEKSKRFLEKPEPAPSVASHDSASSCSHGYNPAVTFRTPQLPRKKIISTPRSAIERLTPSQRKLPADGKSSKKRLDLEYATEKNLIEQINELTRVHTEQLLEKDNELAALHQEQEELRASLSKAESNHIMDYNTMKQKYEKEIETMKVELEEETKTAQEKREEYEKCIAELTNQLKILEENVKNCNAINGDLEFKLAEANINTIEMKNLHAAVESELKNARQVIEKLVEEKKRALKEFQDVYPVQLEKVFAAAEMSIDDLMAKMKERLAVLEREFGIENRDTCRTFYAKIDSLSEDVKDRVEMFEKHSTALQATIKTLADEFDRKINDLVHSFSESVELREVKLEENLKLTEELEETRTFGLEKDIIIVDLRNKIDELQHDLAHLSNQCRKFEIVQSEANKTIHVLSQRLFESESEVERLNDKTEELDCRKDALEEKVISVCNENSLLKIKISELQVSLVKDVKEVENALLAKVESYRRVAVEETQKYRSELEEKQQSVEMLMNEIEFYRAKTAETSEFLNICQNHIASYKQEIKALSKKITTVEDDSNDKVNAQKVLVMELTAELEKCKKKAAQTEKCLKTEVTELEDAKSGLEGELEALSIQKATLDQQIIDFEKEKIALRQECDNARDQLINLETELNLKSSLIFKLRKELNIAKAELEEAQNSLIGATSEIEILVDCAKKTERGIEVLTEENKQLKCTVEKTAETFEGKDLKIETLSQELEECKAYNESLTSRIVVLMNDLLLKESQRETLVQEVGLKSLTLVQASEEYEKMKQMYETETQRGEELEKDNMKYIGELVSDLMLEKQRCSELSCAVEEQKMSTAVLEGTIENLKEELGILNNERSTLQFRILEFEKQMKQAEDDKESLVKEKDDLVEIVKRQWEERELLTNQIENQQDEILGLKQMKNDSFEEEKAIYQAELQNEIFALQQNLEDTQKHVINLQGQRDELIFKLKSAEMELNASEIEKERQDSSLRDLVEKLASLETILSAKEKRKNEYKMYATELEVEKSALKHQINELTEEKERLMEDKKEVSMQMTAESARLTDLEYRSQEAEARCRELERMVGPFQEQLKEFENERQALLAKSENAAKELRTLTQEHAKALGHQNHKQKIHYVMQLTETIANLKKDPFDEVPMDGRNRKKIGKLAKFIRKIRKIMKHLSHALNAITGENEKLLVENSKLRAAMLAQQESSVRKAKGKGKEKENQHKDADSPRKTRQGHASPAPSTPNSPLKIRNAP